MLDRIAASLTELTGADAGGFVLIEDERLRLVSTHRLPDDLRGATADLRTQPGGQTAARPARRCCWKPVTRPRSTS